MRARAGVVAALLTLALGAGSAAAVPTSFTFTGRLLDGEAPLDGDITLDLALYETSNGGTPVWAENHATTADQGMVSVAMGGETPLEPATFAGGDLWLSITVNGTELLPRFQMRSVPYAMRAEVSTDSEAIGGIPADQVQQVLADNCAVGSAIRDIAPDGSVTCEPVGGGGPTIPSGMVGFFDGACPTGWSAYAALTGRVPVGGTANIGDPVGTQLANMGSRTINQVPSHSHTVGPIAATTGNGGGHTPTMQSAGAHTHSLDLNHQWDNSESDTKVQVAEDSPDAVPTVATTSSAGSHTHTMDAVAAHNHSIAIAEFDSGDTGVASVDVTMPYLQLRACRKD